MVKNSSPDGKNINHRCGALYPELLKEEVLLEHADLAIALDGDADRVIMLDEQGNVVDGDKMLGIAALEMIKAGKLKKNTLVVTEYSNLGLRETLEQAGGKVVLTKNGDRYVIEEMRRSNYNLGGEQSGHLIFLDHSTTGDGTISALQILRIMKETGKKLSELTRSIKTYPQVLVNVEIREKKPLEQMPLVCRKIKEIEQKLGKDGRVFVRYSGTQNKLRLMLEGKIKEELGFYAQQIAEEVKKEIGF